MYNKFNGVKTIRWYSKCNFISHQFVEITWWFKCLLILVTWNQSYGVSRILPGFLLQNNFETSEINPSDSIKVSNPVTYIPMTAWTLLLFGASVFHKHILYFRSWDAVWIPWQRRLVTTSLRQSHWSTLPLTSISFHFRLRGLNQSELSVICM